MPFISVLPERHDKQIWHEWVNLTVSHMKYVQWKVHLALYITF